VQMSLSRSKLVPLAVLLGASLQGCSFSALPSSVQIALGHACLEKADEAVTDLVESEKTLGEKHGCDELDEAKLKQYKVDCEEVSKMIVGWAAEFECEVTVADQVVEQCETAGEDCKSGVDAGVKAWTLTKPDVSEDETKEEEKEGFEALLALINECHKGAKDHFENPQGDVDPVAEACSGENKDDLAAMGVDESHCKKYRLKQMIDFTTMVCTGWAMSNPPEGHEGDDVTLEDLKTVVGSFFSLDESAVEGSDRLRLYAESAVKSKRWPKLQTWSNKMAKFGGVSLAALAVLVIVGMKRRSRQVEVQDDQTLMNIE
jgi:hypothetical protein